MREILVVTKDEWARAETLKEAQDKLGIDEDTRYLVYDVPQGTTVDDSGDMVYGADEDAAVLVEEHEGVNPK